MTYVSVVSPRTNGAVNSSNGTRRDQFTNLDANGEVSSPNSLHKEQVLFLGLVNKLLGLRCSDSEGLFAENVLASLEGKHGVLEVMAVRSSDVDDVNIGVGDEISV